MIHKWFLFIYFFMIKMWCVHDGYDMHRDYDVMIWAYIDMWLVYYEMSWYVFDVDMLML